jgi:glycosyltransferase involved in cell wall biosynthesis
MVEKRTDSHRAGCSCLAVVAVLRSPQSESLTMVYLHIDRQLPKTLALRNANRYRLEGAMCGDSDLAELAVSVGEQRFAADRTHLLRTDICRARIKTDPQLRSLLSGFSIPVTLEPVGEPCRRKVTLEARFADGRRYRASLGTVTLEPPVDRRMPLELPQGVSRHELVVICMATYKPDAALFRRQVQSIVEQDYRNWICLVSDDASPAEHRRMIRQVLAQDARFRLVEHDTNVGFYHNFERLLEMAPAEAAYVALADQDDRWYPHKLSSCLKRLTGDTQLVYSDMRIVHRDGQPLADTFWTSRTNHYRHEDLDLLALANTVTGAACLLRASLLERALPFPPRYGDAYHDKWLALMAVVEGGIEYIDAPLYDYVQHGDNVLGHKSESSSGIRAALRQAASFASAALPPRAGLKQRLAARLRQAAALGRVLYEAQHNEGKPIETQIEAALVRRPDEHCRKLLQRPLSVTGLLAMHAKVRRRGLSICNLDIKLLLSRLANRAVPMLRTPLRWLARYGHQRGWFRDRQAFPVASTAAGVRPVADPDIVEFKRKYSGRKFAVEPRPPCINMLISEISPANFLGGYLGMFNLARRMSELGHPVRFLLTDQPQLVEADLEKVRRHDRRLQPFLESAKFEICYNEQTPVRISDSDMFVATSWWTAHLAAEGARQTCYRKFIFLEQEFEPIFYAHGSYRALAEEAYRLDFFPFFSTEVLQQYCLKSGVVAPHNAGEFFNNPVLRFEHDAAQPRNGKKRLLFYARPQPWTLRNMYQLGCVAIDQACRMGAFGDDWELHAVGGTHVGGQVLPCGATITHLGTFDLQRYAELLTEHDVGLSLMHSPHPSLLPMEMASAGMLTVTNTCDIKDEAYFAGISSNIRAVRPTPELIAKALVEMAARAADWPARVAGSRIHWPHDWDIALPDDKLQRALAAIEASHRARPMRRRAA